MAKTGQRPAALVTGGAIRLGKSICLALAKTKFDIALHYNASQEQAEATANEIRLYGVNCTLFRLDLSRTTGIADFMAEVHEAFPRLQILVNSASRFKPATIRQTRPELLEEILAINFRAPFFLMHEFAKRCQSGHIINILDTKIYANDYDYAAYYLSKKALAELTKMAALEFAPAIRVNAVAPGPTIPTAGTGITAFEKETIQAIPLNRTAEAENVTDAILHLIHNDFINGHILVVDGGESLGGGLSSR